MKKQLTLILALSLAVILAIVWLVHTVSHAEITVEADEQIDVTPEQITSIKAIGELEFLSIANEELVDTVRKGLLADDHLVRVYYGTLRLGVNMHQVEPGWIHVDGDSVTVTLPKITLLDRDFIDEARTKPFFETGTWKPEDREALYRQAHNRMLQHGLTKENLVAAEDNAREQITSLMKAMGFKKVRITFKK